VSKLSVDLSRPIAVDVPGRVRSLGGNGRAIAVTVTVSVMGSDSTDKRTIALVVDLRDGVIRPGRVGLFAVQPVNAGEQNVDLLVEDTTVERTLVGTSFDVTVGSVDVQDDPMRFWNEYWPHIASVIGVVFAALGAVLAVRSARKKASAEAK
jgi:hypothetical protein